MITRHYVAVDLGATSGRVILGSLGNDKLELEEIVRFPNKIIRVGGHHYWDIYALYDEILEGLRKIARRGTEVRSIGIDTWGVDFVFIDKNGQLLGNPLSYRDPHTVGEPERFFKHIPAEKVYEITGIQVMNFNSLFQLSALRRQGWVPLNAADKILFTPDAIGYMLTGNAVTEYTIASTSEMLNPITKKFDPVLLEALSLTEDRFGKIVYPGEHLGLITKQIQDITGMGPVPVVSVAGHDTASAVAAVPAIDKQFAYLSSGTWSLMGIESDMPIITKRSQQENFTNEGGIQGTIRFLKNICGMWILERCRAEWKHNGIETDYGQLITETMATEPFRSFIYPDAACFAMPDSMLRTIANYCRDTGQPVPETPAEYARCIFDSLAMRYREVFMRLTELSDMKPETLHVIGGGCRNRLLNQLTANATGIPVVAGPVEATALGNIMIQAQADGVVKDLCDIRTTIARAVETERFEPKDAEIWANAYEKYLKAQRL